LIYSNYATIYKEVPELNEKERPMLISEHLVLSIGVKRWLKKNLQELFPKVY